MRRIATSASIPGSAESAADRLARGEAARNRVAPADHAHWAPWEERPDPVELLERQLAGRPPELVAARYARMLASPLAFFCGAAAVMAFDLAGTPSMGLDVQLCGDAHLANFARFASPERGPVFSLDEFDHTTPGPWEWDVKRLAASVEVAARGRGFDATERRAALLATARSYRTGMRALAAMTNLQAWYVEAPKVAKEHAGDGWRPPAGLAARVDGRPRIAAEPPGIVPVEDDGEREAVGALLRRYRTTVVGDGRRLLEGYRYEDLALIGGVGMRAWIALLCGRDEHDPLFLQIKEADASALQPYVGLSGHSNHGQRVVAGQRLMQAASDILLGWQRATDADGQSRDYYVRQLWPRRPCADLGTLSPPKLARRARMCGWTLARAHARTGDRLAIAGYLGADPAFDEALATFAGAYADQAERDFARLAQAAGSGRIAIGIT